MTTIQALPCRRGGSDSPAPRGADAALLTDQVTS